MKMDLQNGENVSYNSFLVENGSYISFFVLCKVFMNIDRKTICLSLFMKS